MNFNRPLFLCLMCLSVTLILCQTEEEEELSPKIFQDQEDINGEEMINVDGGVDGGNAEEEEEEEDDEMLTSNLLTLEGKLPFNINTVGI